MSRVRPEAINENHVTSDKHNTKTTALPRVFVASEFLRNAYKLFQELHSQISWRRIAARTITRRSLNLFILKL